MNNASDTTCTLYIGNLHVDITKEQLFSLFDPISPVRWIRLKRFPNYTPYAFIEFDSHLSAATTLATMDGKLYMNQALKVNWASNWPKLGAKNHYHVFVGDFSKDIEDSILEEAFTPFGEISSCRVMRDCYTLESKGYAFVSFVNKSDAENAINSMNGKMLRGQIIRTNWSTKTSLPTFFNYSGCLTDSFEEFCKEFSPTNCTVYCGGVVKGLTEQEVEKVFSPFGRIVKIRVFQNKGYGFITFSTKEAAKTAIDTVNKTEINGNPVKCSWGKESIDPKSTAIQVVRTIAKTNTVTGQTYVFGKNSWFPCPPISVPYVPGLRSMNLCGALGYNPYKKYHYQQVDIPLQINNTAGQAVAIGKPRNMQTSVY